MFMPSNSITNFNTGQSTSDVTCSSNEMNESILNFDNVDKLNLQQQFNKDALDFELAVDELNSSFDSLFGALTNTNVLVTV